MAPKTRDSTSAGNEQELRITAANGKTYEITCDGKSLKDNDENMMELLIVVSAEMFSYIIVSRERKKKDYVEGIAFTSSEGCAKMFAEALDGAGRLVSVMTQEAEGQA